MILAIGMSKACHRDGTGIMPCSGVCCLPAVISQPRPECPSFRTTAAARPFLAVEIFPTAWKTGSLRGSFDTAGFGHAMAGGAQRPLAILVLVIFGAGVHVFLAIPQHRVVGDGIGMRRRRQASRL